MQEIDISKIPYYNELFSKLIAEMRKNCGGLQGFLSAIKNIRKYLILQPNIGGFGLNVEKMLDDLEK